jgi:hypothetical protein
LKSTGRHHRPPPARSCTRRRACTALSSCVRRRSRRCMPGALARPASVVNGAGLVERSFKSTYERTCVRSRRASVCPRVRGHGSDNAKGMKKRISCLQQPPRCAATAAADATGTAAPAGRCRRAHLCGEPVTSRLPRLRMVALHPLEHLAAPG